MAELYGPGWAAACTLAGVHPLEATADDILGPVPRGVWGGRGKRVLSFDEQLFGEADEDDLSLATPAQSTKEFTEDVAVVAGLTRQEARVVHAIVDGSPIPEGQSGYVRILATRLRTTPDAIKKAWSRAKKKLIEEWTA